MEAQRVSTISKIFRSLIHLVFIAAFFFIATTLSVQPQPDAGAIMKNIWSPYCKGVSLLECPSSQAEKLRTEITQRMKNGESFDQIYADLTERYGPILRMAPQTSGREGLAYWLPWIAFGALLIGLLIYWSRRTRPLPAASSSESIKNHDRRIMEEMEERLR